MDAATVSSFSAMIPDNEGAYKRQANGILSPAMHFIPIVAGERFHPNNQKPLVSELANSPLWYPKAAKPDSTHLLGKGYWLKLDPFFDRRTVGAAA
jgi:hypothetical protein